MFLGHVAMISKERQRLSQGMLKGRTCHHRYGFQMNVVFVSGNYDVVIYSEAGYREFAIGNVTCGECVGCKVGSSVMCGGWNVVS